MRTKKAILFTLLMSSTLSGCAYMSYTWGNIKNSLTTPEDVVFTEAKRQPELQNNMAAPRAMAGAKLKPVKTGAVPAPLAVNPGMTITPDIAAAPVPAPLAMPPMPLPPRGMPMPVPLNVGNDPGAWRDNPMTAPMDKEPPM